METKRERPVKVVALKQQIIVRTPGELKREVEERAAREGRTLSDVVREFLESYAGKTYTIRPYHRKAQ